MKTGNLKILLGAILLLAGGLAIPAGLLVPAFGAPNENVVFETPGEATLEIEAPGRFYLWHKYRTIHQGRQVVRDEHLPDGMSFRVSRLDDGSSIPFQARSNIHTEIGDAESRSIGYVDIERPGTFMIEVTGGDEQTRIMSFSRSRMMLFARAIGFSLLSLVVLGSLGVVLIVFGIGQRAGEA
ncbi:MAG: hypothetical protein CMP07_04080 [Xanthomonadales bacterium]|nr:hypothetical protein [Xanthomonadales bacterium]|tara:strand:+ start:321 stop:869 length:549 start_codon:yes stop_codon:yes gene_type:complete